MTDITQTMSEHLDTAREQLYTTARSAKQWAEKNPNTAKRVGLVALAALSVQFVTSTLGIGLLGILAIGGSVAYIANKHKENQSDSKELIKDLSIPTIAALVGSIIGIPAAVSFSAATFLMHPFNAHSRFLMENGSVKFELEISAQKNPTAPSINSTVPSAPSEEEVFPPQYELIYSKMY